jgi:cyclin-A
VDLLGPCSKYEEITPPNVEDFCYITDNTYTKQEVTVQDTFVSMDLVSR